MSMLETTTTRTIFIKPKGIIKVFERYIYE